MDQGHSHETVTPEWLWFHVAGEPRPQGSKRGFVTKSGRVAMVDMSKGLRTWRDSVAEAAQRAAVIFDWHVTEEPVNVALRFTMKKPLRPKYGFPIRPDVDKLIRAAFDGITDSRALWKDDSFAERVTAQKTYGEPGLSVLLWKKHS